MFGKTYKLPFRLLGIPVLLDVTLLIVLPLFTWLIGTGIQQKQDLFGMDTSADALRVGALPYLLGFLAVFGLFLSVVIHELGHAVTARAFGVRTTSITLWLLGGVAALESIPRRRGAEAVIGIAGPIVSVALAGLFYGLLFVIPTDMNATRFLVHYLAAMNLVLAIFNLLPALPLDGGRVLRSLLAIKLDYLQATQAAANISRVLAILLGILGFMGGGFMLILVAFFIFMAVNSESQTVVVERMLNGISVGQLMNHEVVTVQSHSTVAELTSAMIRERHKGFPVVDLNGRPVGMVDLERLAGAPPETRVQQIMNPQIPTIAETAPALDAYGKMGRAETARMIVVNDAGNMTGIITRHDLIRAIQIRLAAMYPSSGHRPPPATLVAHDSA